jgi:3-oxoacyl-[acyl-carrier protein] reductase
LDVFKAVPMSVAFNFVGRVVVVTGAATGIGAALSRQFMAAGADVHAVDVSPVDIDCCTAHHCDVSDLGAVTGLVGEIVRAHGRLDVIVNNAGILRDKMLWRLPLDDWSAVIAVHLTGTFLLTQAASPVMREQGYGRIVNVTSYTGLHGNVGQAAYAAAKSGIIGFTKTAAKELAPFGITVNAISPNAETAMVATIPPERYQELKRQIPIGRFAEPEEMFPAVGFLASEQAGYVTGVVLPVDGGLSM